MTAAKLKGRAAASARPKRRAAPSLTKILEGVLRAIANRGVKRLTMREICTASHVSRATLYRYFSTKEDVLAAVTEYICVNFEEGVMAVAAEHDDPLERFRAVMDFFAQYARERAPEPMLELEPHFYLDFFRSHFSRHKVAVCAALAPSFDHFEAAIGAPLNRTGIAEALVRMQLSTLMVPGQSDWVALWNETPEIIAGALPHLAGKSRTAGA